MKIFLEYFREKISVFNENISEEEGNLEEIFSFFQSTVAFWRTVVVKIPFNNKNKNNTSKNKKMQKTQTSDCCKYRSTLFLGRVLLAQMPKHSCLPKLI